MKENQFKYLFVTNFSMPDNYYIPSMLLFAGKIYVVGGSDGQYSLSTVEIFDMETQTWSHGPNLSVPRANVGLAVHNSRLFAIGGFNGKDFLDSVEYLAPDKDEWCCFLPSLKARGQTSSSESSDSETHHISNKNVVKKKYTEHRQTDRSAVNGLGHTDRPSVNGLIGQGDVSLGKGLNGMISDTAKKEHLTQPVKNKNTVTENGAAS